MLEKRLLRGCLRSIFQYGLKTNCRRNKGLKPLVYIDLWGVQRSNFGFSDILLDLLSESANSPHPPTPSPKEGEGEPEIGSYGNFFVSRQVPLPTWERDLG